MLHPQCRGPRVQFPVRELDPTYRRGKFCMLQLRPIAAKERKEGKIDKKGRRGRGKGGSEERKKGGSGERKTGHT